MPLDDPEEEFLEDDEEWIVDVEDEVELLDDIDYKVVSSHGDRVLIEYEDMDGVRKRGILPTRLHTQLEGSVSEDNETLIVPYGVDWYYLLENLVPNKEDFIHALATRLLEMGIWTYEDFRKKQPAEITGAILRSCGFDYQKLNRLIESNK